MLRLSLFMLIAFVFSVAIQHAASAQPATGAAGPCKTSTGKDGRLFQSIFGYVFSPFEFDRVETSGISIDNYPTRDPAGRRMFYTQAVGTATLTFITRETKTYSCTVNVMPFDNEQNSDHAISIGDCGWMTADNPLLPTDIARTIWTKKRFNEVAIGEPEIAGKSPLSDNLIYLFGRKPGTTVVALTDGDGVVFSQCPVHVIDASAFFANNPSDPASLCRDADNRPARLKPGAEFKMLSTTPFVEAAIANPELIDATLLNRHEVLIKAISTGTTTITTVGQHRSRDDVRNCLVDIRQD